MMPVGPSMKNEFVAKVWGVDVNMPMDPRRRRLVASAGDDFGERQAVANENAARKLTAVTPLMSE